MQVEVGAILEGKITGITKFGAFVELPESKTGMVHISEVANTYVKEITDHIKNGQVVKVKVLTIDEKGKIGLSIKKAAPPPPVRNEYKPAPPVKRPGSFEWKETPKPEGGSFEDMMSKFKQSSDEKMSDLKRVMDSKRGSFSRRGGGGGGAK